MALKCFLGVELQCAWVAKTLRVCVCGLKRTSFGDQILQHVTDETKLRAPLEERGQMIDVANLASKNYAALPEMRLFSMESTTGMAASFAKDDTSQKILDNPSRSVSLISLKICSPTSCGQLTRLWLQNWQAELYSFLASQQLNTYQGRSQPRKNPETIKQRL